MGAFVRTLRAVSRSDVLADVSESEAEKLLAAIVAEARARNPGATVDDAGFVAYLAERLPKDTPITKDVVSAIHAADLYLAYACSLGDRAAIARFRATIVADLDRAIVPVSSDEMLEEIRQLVMDRLLVAADGEPKIAAYHGKGALHAWVRVTATRMALTLARVRPREAVSLADLALEAEPEANPEILHLKATYRHEVKVSIERALAELVARDRVLLRYTLLDGLTADELGALYGVHRATAARWVVAAREALARVAKKELTTRLGLDNPELPSLFSLIDSQFEMRWSLFHE